MIETQIRLARPELGSEEEEAVLEVMRSGLLAQGEKVKAFEEAFAEATGARYAIATSNGSTALQLALLAHGVESGDEVITSPLTFVASANAIVHAGGKAVFADVDATLNLDPGAAEAAITERTRAIMPVHLHGNPSDFWAFAEIADRHSLVVLQDACQAIGATIDGRPLGALGTAVYSLYATKNITTGEGGMITTNDPAVAQACASLRNQAYSTTAAYEHEAIGYNYRMTEMQAAIGLCQLRKLARITERRRENAWYYDVAVDQGRFPRPSRLPGHAHVFHQYVIRLPESAGLSRSQVQADLERNGIGSGVHYPIPVHLQPAYRGHSIHPCPEAERAAREILSIPVHPGVEDPDRERVAAALNGLGL